MRAMQLHISNADSKSGAQHAMFLQATYAELQHAVREKFPDAGPLILKYLDREGDLVTITDRNDLQVALKEVIDHADRLQTQHGGPRLPNMIPPLRLHAVKASKEVRHATQLLSAQITIKDV